ncbi:MAG: ribonuclease [Clostridia bacterium]|nr:ribonuclease [Clostridia bacterium]
MKLRKLIAVLLALLCVTVLLAGCFQQQEPGLTGSDPLQSTAQSPETKAPTNESPTDPRATSPPAALDESGSYNSKDEVALYIHTFGHLPPNYLTKKQAKALGWTGGSLEKYAPGKSIGGDRFGNYEGRLPEAPDRIYTECDIDTLGKSSRGAKRIVFSNDGLIFYTNDHYTSFTLLYGEE